MLVWQDYRPKERPGGLRDDSSHQGFAPRHVRWLFGPEKGFGSKGKKTAKCCRKSFHEGSLSELWAPTMEETCEYDQENFASTDGHVSALKYAP